MRLIMKIFSIAMILLQSCYPKFITGFAELEPGFWYKCDTGTLQFYQGGNLGYGYKCECELRSNSIIYKQGRYSVAKFLSGRANWLPEIRPYRCSAYFQAHGSKKYYLGAYTTSGATNCSGKFVRYYIGHLCQPMRKMLPTEKRKHSVR